MSSGFLNISEIQTENSFVVNTSYNISLDVVNLSENQPIYFVANGAVAIGKYKSYASVGRGSNKKIVATIESEISPEIEHPYIFVFGEPDEEEVNYEEFNTYLESIRGLDSNLDSDLTIISDYVQQFLVQEPDGPKTLKQITGVISVDYVNVEENTYTFTASAFTSSGGFSLKELTVGNELVINSTNSEGIKKYIKYSISDIITEGRGSNTIYYISFESIDGYTPLISKGDSVLVVYSSVNNFVCLPITSDGVSTDVVIQARNQNLFDFDDVFVEKINKILKNIYHLVFEVNNIKASNLESLDVLNKYINREISKLDVEVLELSTRIQGLDSRTSSLENSVNELFNTKLSGVETSEVPENTEDNVLYFIDAKSEVIF